MDRLKQINVTMRVGEAPRQKIAFSSKFFCTAGVDCRRKRPLTIHPIRQLQAREAEMRSPLFFPRTFLPLRVSLLFIVAVCCCRSFFFPFTTTTSTFFSSTLHDFSVTYIRF